MRLSVVTSAEVKGGRHLTAHSTPTVTVVLVDSDSRAGSAQQLEVQLVPGSLTMAIDEKCFGS